MNEAKAPSFEFMRQGEAPFTVRID